MKLVPDENKSSESMSRSFDATLFPLGRNVALSCSTAQSSYFGPPGGTQRGAVQGRKDGTYGFHTENEDQPWWMVDLGQIRKITGMAVYNRLDQPCPERAKSLMIACSPNEETWFKYYKNNGMVFGGVDSAGPLIIRNVVEARYVRFMLQERNYLHLDEVEIFSNDAV